MSSITLTLYDTLKNVLSMNVDVVVLHVHNHHIVTKHDRTYNAELHDIFMGSSYRNIGRNFKHDIISLTAKLEPHYAC